jgi:hypothetical protein
LGNFYTYTVIPNERKIIVDILINYLKEQTTTKSNKDEDNKFLISALNALINISMGDNEKFLLDGGAIPLLLSLVDSSDTNVWKNAVHILSNICYIESVEDKNSIINYGIFDVFYKKLLEISPFPPQKIISSNYYSIYCIILGIANLLISNPSGVTSFLKTPLIPLLLHTLNSTILIGNTSSDKDIGKIQLYTCECFLNCICISHKNTLSLVKMKVIDSLLNFIEMYINEIKENKILLNKQLVKVISIIFFNTGYYGSTAGSKEEKNKFKNYFDENNRLNKLLNLFKYLISQTLSPTQKETINNISVTICCLLKNEKPPLCYGCVLQYMNNFKSSPPPTSGYYFPLYANEVWNEMSKADECLWNSYQFRELIVVENFDIKNGLLGLHQYSYLNIIQFLNSSVVRKV